MFLSEQFVVRTLQDLAFARSFGFGVRLDLVGVFLVLRGYLSYGGEA